MFIGIYIQPEGARHFNVNMYAEVATVLIDCHGKGITPDIAGDFNVRPGNLA